MTKAHFVIVVLFLIAGIFSGCGIPAETISDPAGTPFDIAAEIIGSQREIPLLMSLSHGEEAFVSYLTQTYSIPEDGFADGVIYYAGGVEASEIAVLVFSDDATAQAARDALLDYIEGRADSFTGYVPEQAALVEGSTAVNHGRYVALLICADPTAAQNAFLACFEEGWVPTAQIESIESPEPSYPPIPETTDDVHTVTESEAKSEPPEPQEEGSASIAASEPSASIPVDATFPAYETPKPTATPTAAPEPSEPAQMIEDHYDRDAVLAAWQNGDPSDLSEKNRTVYDNAVAAIAQVITDDMTPYQQELAIHDYIIAYGRYDSEANSNAPDAAPDPDNNNPYGMLVKGVGICQGYSSTFQLFMDMLGIECMTVAGQSGRAEHAWNMVRLDGEWYCVDVTWDDPAGSTPSHRYFNVTSQFLRMTNHQWDESGVPEATGTFWEYQG